MIFKTFTQQICLLKKSLLLLPTYLQFVHCPCKYFCYSSWYCFYFGCSCALGHHRIVRLRFLFAKPYTIFENRNCLQFWKTCNLFYIKHQTRHSSYFLHKGMKRKGTEWKKPFHFRIKKQLTTNEIQV